MTGFSERLSAAVRRCRTPLVVGLDPRWDQLPVVLTQNRDPGDPRQAAEGFRQFCISVIDVVAPLVPAVKPQWAFFEQFGSFGLAALEEIVAHARARGLLVIGDAKRGDIGSTAEAYAAAFFSGARRSSSPIPPQCDALTVNPYLGVDTLRPSLQGARASAAGIFVLVKTSNPGSGDFQDLQLQSGQRLYQAVAERVAGLASENVDGDGWGDVGAVVGATYPEQLAELRLRMPRSWILVPGFGAQGASAADTAGAFRSDGLGALVNSSRGILFAFHNPQFRSAGDWERAIESACRDVVDQLRGATPAGRL